FRLFKLIAILKLLSHKKAQDAQNQLFLFEPFVPFCGSFLINNSQQVRYLRHGATHRIRVRTLHDLIQLSQTKTAHDRLVRFRRVDKAAIVLDANLAFGCLFVSGFTRHITSPQLACRASEPIPSDPSCATTRRKSRAQRCADWSSPALSY